LPGNIVSDMAYNSFIVTHEAAIVNKITILKNMYNRPTLNKKQ